MVDAPHMRIRADDDAARDTVRAPLRAALDRIITWGAVGYALAAVVVAVPALCPLPPDLHEAAHVALPVLVVAHLVVRTAIRVAAGPPSGEATRAAWAEARAFDRSTTLVAAVVVAAGSIGLLLALFVLVVPHVTNAAEAGLYAAVWIPLLGVIWALATVSIVEGARDRLAYAVEESDRRLRAYWTAVAGR